VLGILQ
jgi:hypothetical protein